jgi:putative Mn2+ efflux pump MntP
VLLLLAVLVALVSNVDNLAVGVAFGMRGQRVALAPNSLIVAITMAGTFGAMSSGRALATLLPPEIGSDLGGTIIAAIGVGAVTASVTALWRPARDAPARVGRMLRSPRMLSWRDAVPVGVALSLNNIGSGVGAGAAGVSPVATTLLAGVFSLAFVGGGSVFGWSIGQRVGRRAPLVAGIVLVGLGAAMLDGVA